MRKIRFTKEQVVAILSEADRTTVANAAEKHNGAEKPMAPKDHRH